MASVYRRFAQLLAGAAGVCAGAASAFAAAPLLSPPAIEQQLRSFNTLGTVLHIGAHPDDENTQLITYLSLGRGYRTAYLSLTRGDGGQNELGPDFDEKLGVARTEELLAARRLDGGRQFFSRAIDFGYSKTPEETLRFWDRKEVLGDVVRVIREFQPDVIVTRFPIPPGSGGHGHHTASAILAVEAFQLAGDPTAYPEQLRQGLTVWQPKRIVWNSWGGARGTGGLTGPTVTLDIGGTDPVSGETFGTIANRSRGMHKTQGMGGFANRQATGPNVQTFMLLGGLPGAWPGQMPAGQQAGTVTAPAQADLMDGVDLTWNRVPGGAAIAPLAAAALAKFDPKQPAASVPALLAIRAKVIALAQTPLVTDKLAQLDHILVSCLGLHVETTIDQAEVVPGEPVVLHYSLSWTNWIGMPGRPALHYEATSSPGLALKPNRSPVDVSISASTTGTLTGTLPLDTPISQPYWLRADGAAGIARVDDPTLIGRPENPPAIPIEHVFTIDGQTLVVPDEPVQLVAGASEAQARRRIIAIPPVSLAFDSNLYLVAPGSTKTVTITVSANRADTSGVLRPGVPAGWSITPTAEKFQLNHVGDHHPFTFTLTANAAGAAVRLTAVAEVDGRAYSNERQVIDYTHLPLIVLQPTARARLLSIPLATRGSTVGYLPGAGDSVAECIAQMGCIVRPLTGADLTPARLQGLDAVVIGVRAFNERPDLAAALPGLLAWVEAGGTVIAQYNRPNGLKTAQLGPYPLSIEGPAPDLRVTDEDSPVSFLAPDSSALNSPNKISAADFTGWVQERGAYFPSSWDDHYTPILAMNDPGEAPLKSSLLVARYGKGHYVYTGLGFFRQLPAGVPGAYRLFANLLALGKQ